MIGPGYNIIYIEKKIYIMEQTFEGCGYAERKLLIKIIPILCKNKSYDYELSNPESTEIWDGKLFFNGKRLLLEVKIRTEHYSELFLEVKKFRSLMKMKNEKNFDAVYYINETPKGIYVARIDTIDTNIKHISYIKMNEYTVVGKLNKVRKPVYMLSVEKEYKKII